MTIHVLDCDREDTTLLADLGELVVDADDGDHFARLPLRVTHSCLGGVMIEIGPYTFADGEVELLREAIRRHDIAVNGPTIRRVQ